MDELVHLAGYQAPQEWLSRRLRSRSVALETVVHEDIGRLRRLPSSLGYVPHSVTRSRVRFLDSIIGLEVLDRSIVGAARSEQCPDDRKVGRESLGDLGLLIQRGHPSPRVEHVCDVVGREKCEVIGPKVVLIADFYSVTEPLRQLREEWVQFRQEVAWRGEGLLIEGSELED